MAAGTMMRVTMEVGSDGVTLITMRNPPVNALHPASKPRQLFPFASIAFRLVSSA